MKNRIRWMTFICLVLFLNACGGGGGGGSSSNDNGGSSSAQGFPPAVSPKVQVYSALGQGVNIIPQIEGEDLLGCTIIANTTGEAQQVNGQVCAAFIEEVQRPPAPFCQVLLNNRNMIAFEPSKCTRLVTDGQIASTQDLSAKRAAVHGDRVLNYWLNHHKRKGLDNQNTDLVSMVHVGHRLQNAFYDPQMKVMSYGDGDGQSTLDFTLAGDVAAHEMTHGVVAYTARLIYQDQSGALDEATADFFGELATEPTDWKIGKEVNISGAPIRDIANPGSLTITFPDENGNPVNIPYPSNINQTLVVPADIPCDATNDQCFVHFNSTVPSHAGYQMVQALGAEKAEKIYYLALTQYFTPFTGFQDAADSMLLACKQLYSDADCARVSASWASVGLPPRVTTSDQP